MKYSQIALNAARWTWDQIGCAYSQANRTQARIFDCSSLVARAYTAQGKKWKHGGSVPISMQEVYDDDFQLIWPESYNDIGKRFGGDAVIRTATQPGDLQFICTDSDTERSNKITHVAMVADEKRIVHARSSKHGVCSNEIGLYSGKICAVVRYNPECPLRYGMKGWRTLALQKALNACGFNLDVDGDFGSATRKAVQRFQEENGLAQTGVADAEVLRRLGGAEQGVSNDVAGLCVIGNRVNLRRGPGTEYESVTIAHKGELLKEVVPDGWVPVHINGNVLWISEKYIEKK